MLHFVQHDVPDYLADQSNVTPYPSALFKAMMAPL